MHGLDPTTWSAARDEVRAILVGVARRGRTIAYGQLVGQLKTAILEPQSAALAALLKEISAAEANAGRGMLTVVVVHARDQQPGPRFYTLADELGRDTRDKLKCWIAESKVVYAAWK